jgi:type VI secretion system secreted protein Hcp
MMKKLACATLALVAAMPMSASAAIDYFLKIDGIKGESTDDKHKDEIELLTWSWGGTVEDKSTVFAPFSWEQGLDSSFVPLFLGLANGTSFKNVLMTARKSGGKSDAEFFKMTLSDARVVKLTSNGSEDSIEVLAEMSYKSIKMSYCPQKKDGSLDKCIDGTFDLDKAGQARFSGDPMVVRGLAESGGSLDFMRVATTVPEPSTWASFAAGLIGLAAVVRRRRSAPGAAPP